jgi:hypothetical protein
MTDGTVQTIVRQAAAAPRRRRRGYFPAPLASDRPWGRTLIIGLVLFLLGSILTHLVAVFIWARPMPNRLCWSLTLTALLISTAGVWIVTAASRTSPGWQRPRRWLTRVLFLAYVLPAGLGMVLGPYVDPDAAPRWPIALLLVSIPVCGFAMIFLTGYLAELSGVFGNTVLRTVYKVIMILAVLGTIHAAITIVVYLGDGGERYIATMQREMARLYGEQPMSRSSAAISTMDIIFPGRFMLKALIAWTRTSIIRIVPGLWLIATIHRQYKRAA